MRFSEALSLAATTGGEPRDIALLANYEVDTVATFLRAHGARDGVRYAISTTAFGSLRQAIDGLAADGRRHTRAVCVTTIEDALPELGLRAGALRDRATGAQLTDGAGGRVREHAAWLVERLAQVADRAVVVPASAAVTPWIGGRAQMLLRTLPQRLEVELADCALRTGAVHIAWPAGVLGADFHDDRLLFEAGSPWNAAASDAIAAAAHAVLSPRPACKVLFTDLDNTVWDGLLGEDGPEGISAHPDGRAWAHFVYQRLLLLLRSEGVLLVAVTRNDPDLVRLFLSDERRRTAAGVVLSWDDFATVESHWGAKSEAVSRACERLGLSPTMGVLVDDDPVEGAEVIHHHPGLTLLQMPGLDGVSELVRRLRELFPGDVLSEEDTRRGDLYALRSTVERLRPTGVTDHLAFLRSLDMRATITLTAEVTHTRPLQLLNRANQFTLTGNRYDEPAWAALLAAHPGRSVVALALIDRFGDHGTVLVAVIEDSSDGLTVLELAMSCRVLNRTVEVAFLAWLLRRADGGRVTLHLRRTPSNAPAREFVRRHAATTGERDDDGGEVLEITDTGLAAAVRIAERRPTPTASERAS